MTSTLLGAVLWRLFLDIHHTPWSANSRHLIAAARNNLHWDIRDNELLTITKKSLATAPEERYQSVAEFQSALRGWQRHAESITLTNRALTLANDAGADVQTSSQAVFLLDQALDLWSRNERAQQARQQAQLALINALLESGALDEAEALIDSSNELHSNLFHRLTTAKDIRSQAIASHTKLRDLEEQTDIRWQVLLDEDFRSNNTKWDFDAEDHHFMGGKMVFSGGRPAVARCLTPLNGDFRLSFTASVRGRHLSDLSCFFAAYPHEDTQQLIESGYQVKLGCIQ